MMGERRDAGVGTDREPGADEVGQGPDDRRHQQHRIEQQQRGSADTAGVQRGAEPRGQVEMGQQHADDQHRGCSELRDHHCRTGPQAGNDRGRQRPQEPTAEPVLAHRAQRTEHHGHRPRRQETLQRRRSDLRRGRHAGHDAGDRGVGRCHSTDPQPAVAPAVDADRAGDGLSGPVQQQGRDQQQAERHDAEVDRGQRPDRETDVHAEQPGRRCDAQGTGRAEGRTGRGPRRQDHHGRDRQTHGGRPGTRSHGSGQGGTTPVRRGRLRHDRTAVLEVDHPSTVSAKAG